MEVIGASFDKNEIFFPWEKVAQSREKPIGVRTLILSTCASMRKCSNAGFVLRDHTLIP